MRSNRLLLMSLCVLVLFAGGVFASTATIQPVDSDSDQIFFDEIAQFQLTLTNTQAQEQIFTVNSNPIDWVIQSASSTRVGAGETKTIELAIQPRQSNYRSPGYYEVPLSFTGSAGESFETTTNIFIRSAGETAYRPSVLLGASIDDEVDPRKPVSVQVSIRNRNILDLDEVRLVINGENFQMEEQLSLVGLEEKNLEYHFDVDPLTYPDTYELNVRLFYDDTILGEVREQYTIKGYSVIDRETKDISSRFFKYTKVSTITNNANIVKSITSDLSIPWFQRPFTSISVDASNAQQTGSSSWDIKMEPQEAVEITVVQNYRAIPLIVLLGIIAVILYFTLRSPITLRKQTFVTGKDEQGISEMKVRIYIRNRTGKSFYNIRVLDRTPAIAKVVVSEGLGVLAPTDIVRTQHKGSVIKWDFETLEPFEERIVTYNIKVKLKIVGNLALSPVKAKFENVKGVPRTTKSGKAQIAGAR